MSHTQSKDNRLPLIYVVSNGRSGSTLLDLLLGSIPGIWTVGEAQRLFLEIENSKLCGCGKQFSSCGFWKSLVPKIKNLTKSFPIDYFRLPKGAGQVLRWSHLLHLLLGMISIKTKGQIRAYGNNNLKYLSAVRRHAEKQSRKSLLWIVDASKDPYRLLWLLESNLFDIRVIHLMKDPRGFVYSTANRTGSFPLLLSMRMTLRWIVENQMAAHLAANQISRKKFMFLRYEDLAVNPGEVRKKLAIWLGVKIKAWSPASFRNKTNHAISGNKMRWSSSPIMLDERWRNKLPFYYRWIIAAITFPWRMKYGYK